MSTESYGNEGDFNIDLDDLLSEPSDEVNPNEQPNDEFEIDLDSIDLSSISSLGLGYAGSDSDVEEDEFELDLDSEEFLMEDVNLLAVSNNDDEWSDNDFYTSTEAMEEAKSKAIESTKKKKKKQVVSLEESGLFNYNVLNAEVYTYPKNIVNYYNAKFNSDNSEKILGSSVTSTPTFLDINAENTAFEVVSMNPNVDFKKLYHSLNIHENYKQDEAKFALFSDWLSELRDLRLKQVNMAQYSEDTMRYTTFTFLDSFLPFTLDNCSKIGMKLQQNLLVTFNKFISNGKVITHYICPKCGEKVIMNKDFMVFLYDSSNVSLIYSPLECGCGAMSIFSKPDYEFLVKKFNPYYKNLKPEYSNPMQSLRSYVPSIFLIEEWLSEICNVEVEVEECTLLKDPNEQQGEDLAKTEQYDVDWESACKDFKTFITMIGDAKFRLNSASNESYVNRSNLTKILINQVSSYSVLKENALASLIGTLINYGLSDFSLANKCFLQNFYNVKDVNSVSEITLESLSNVLPLDIIRDGKVSKERFNEVLNLLRGQYDSFEERFTEFLDSLEENKYSLSFIPVATLRLKESDYYDYFYDERLSVLLNEIADLMLLNYIAEDLFNSLSLPDVKGNAVRASISFNRAKSDLLDVNKAYDRDKHVGKLLAMMKVADVIKPSSLMITSVPDADNLNILSNFLKACYNRDVYDIYKYYGDVMRMTSGSSDNSFMMSVGELVRTIPHESLDGDKFSFYFDFDCDRSFKARFVRLYEEKGFIPNEIKGDSVEEKLNFYESCVYDDNNVKDFVPNELEEVLSRFKYVYTFGQFVNYHNLFKDFVSYLFMRDVVCYMSKLKSEHLLHLLSLSPEICSILLEDDYVMPPLDPNVLSDYNLLSLPIFDGALSNSIAKSKSLANVITLIRTSTTNLSLCYSELPALIDVLDKALGDKV